MKLLVMSLLLAMLPAFQASPKKHKYTGPKCLSAFCFDGGSREKLASTFGSLPKKEKLYCYKTTDSNAYIQYEVEDEYKVDGRFVTIGEMVITDFSNCNKETSSLPRRLPQAAWKTPEGIGLGSSEQDVVRAYGNPAARDPVTAASIAAMMRAVDAGKPKEVPADAGDTMLTYNSDFADLRLAWILLRHGKVSGIRLADIE
jgi:hypothetical protein